MAHEQANCNLITAYGLDQIPCNNPKLKFCGNKPFCLHGIASAYLLSDCEIVESDEASDSDKGSNIIYKKGLLGLKNVGTLCYLNSFLQIYYRFHDLRQAIFKLPNDDSGVVHNLQLLFTKIQLSEEDCLDPDVLAASLGLSSNLMQDAPEFHNLFLQLLERKFEDYDIISKLFRGHCLYVRKCLSCLNTSTSQSTFQEIELKSDCDNLYDAVISFLQAESLSGNNQYSCPRCIKMCDGELSTQWIKLPQILCFQIMRFYFDVQTQTRKKVAKSFSFPELFNLSPFLVPVEDDNDENKPETVYILKGILAHLGPSPYQGHYVCAIRDRNLDWILCNDQTVTQFSLKKFDLQLELDKATVQKSTSAKKKRLMNEQIESKTEFETIYPWHPCPNKIYHSTDAYLLFYERIDSFVHHQTSKEFIPQAIVDEVEECNRNLLIQKQLAKEKHKDDQEKSLHLHCEMQRIFNKLSISSNAIEEFLKTVNQQQHEEDALARNIPEDWEFVPTAWLRKCLSLTRGQCMLRLPSPLQCELAWKSTVLKNEQQTNESGGDNNEGNSSLSTLSLASSILCPHGKLPVSIKKSRYRIVSAEAVDELLNLAVFFDDNAEPVNRNGRLFVNNHMCSLCLVHDNQLAQFRLERTSIQKLIKQQTSSSSSKESYWIGVTSFKYWNKFAESIFSQHEQTTSRNLANDFNRDLLCEHGELSPEIWTRQEINSEIWNAICQLFPFDVPTFPCSTSQSCETCLIFHNIWLDVAKQESFLLFDLANNVNRPKLLLNDPLYLSEAQFAEKFPFICEVNVCKRLFCISKEFVNQWKKFLKTPSADERPTSALLRANFCSHNKLTAPLDKEIKDYFLINEEEMRLFQMFYPKEENQDGPIEIIEFINSLSNSKETNTGGEQHASENDGHNEDEIQMVILCELCPICESERAMEKAQYEDSKIYIRLMDGRFDQSSIEKMCDSLQSNSFSFTKSDSLQNESLIAVGNDQQQIVHRRSSRRRKLRSDITCRVASQDNIRSLKLQLISSVKASPIDQHIVFNKQELFEMDTLIDVGIKPGDILYLWIDMPDSDEEQMQTENFEREVGFDGTLLCNGGGNR